jgi:hypothetical protein
VCVCARAIMSPTHRTQFAAPKGMFKKATMTVGSAMPAGSRPRPPQMPVDSTIVNQVQHLREAGQ